MYTWLPKGFIEQITQRAAINDCCRVLASSITWKQTKNIHVHPRPSTPFFSASLLGHGTNSTNCSNAYNSTHSTVSYIVGMHQNFSESPPPAGPTEPTGPTNAT